MTTVEKINKIKEIIKKYQLSAHPEGGFYREIWRAKTSIKQGGKKYSAGTNIFYLLRNKLTYGDFSAWHKLIDLDETWYFHQGSPLLIYVINEKGFLTEHKLGLNTGCLPQINIQRNCWFAALVESNEKQDAFSFVSCAVFPGFDFKNFVLADRTNLLQQYPQHKLIIKKLTKNSSQQTN